MATPPTPLEPSCDVSEASRDETGSTADDSARRERLRELSAYSAAIFGMLGRRWSSSTSHFVSLVVGRSKPKRSVGP